MGYDPKLNDHHKAYIKKCLASFILSPKTITDSLADPEIAEANEFKPVTITVQRISFLLIQMKKNPEITEEIAELRALYLVDFTDVPLAHKKERIKVLTARFYAIPEMKDSKGGNLSDRVKLDYEMKKIYEASKNPGNYKRINPPLVYSTDPSTDASKKNITNLIKDANLYIEENRDFLDDLAQEIIDINHLIKFGSMR